MSEPKFVHLRMHSEFTILDSTIKIDKVLERAKKDGQGALALTDYNNIFGLVKFYRAAMLSGIKPIVGCDLTLNSLEAEDRVLVLVKNQKGYKNLCRLLTSGHLRGKDGRDDVLVTKDQMNIHGLAGTIILSGGESGDVGRAILNNDSKRALKLLRDWDARFPGNFYIEIQRYGLSSSEYYISEALELSAKSNVPVVVTHPVQFLRPWDHRAHEIRACASEGDVVSNRNRRRFTVQQYFKSQEEMCRLFRDIPIALSNTVELSKRCNLNLNFDRVMLPRFHIPRDIPVQCCFVRFIAAILRERVREKSLRISFKTYRLYKQRLFSEFSTVLRMNFCGYFLIVSDFIRWAKANEVAVGPGRGSGAGSFLAFALKITDINPIKYGLLFERFLNPDRISMPDFDVDFCQARRDRVIQYVKEKYGQGLVSQITTFGTLTARSAIRDVGRALNLRYALVDSIAKLIPVRPNLQITISWALETEEALLKRYEEENNVRRLINLALEVENLIRNVAVHAGGVIISPAQLSDICPLYTQDELEDVLVSQYDKDDAEHLGLIKFDFLGLTTLTILDSTAKHIKIIYGLTNWSLDNISGTDRSTYKLLQKADTVAVFQLESFGMRRILRMAKPDCMEDIIALVALYRPGPMKLIGSFFRRKHKKENIKYLDDKLKGLLEETYGIIVYQEQVMQIARTIGGYTLAEADLLRRAMSKKKADEMLEHRTIFQHGASRKGIGFSRSGLVFDLMEKFASYGFNKSHAAAYALLSYQTAWAKVHYPAEFMASNLSWSLAEPDRLNKLYKDCKFMGLVLLQPNINHSYYQFVPLKYPQEVRSKTIMFGLGAIKGTGKIAVQEIVRVREERPFDNILDFCARLNRKIVSRKVIESLIKAGAFDALHERARYKLLRILPLVLRYSDELNSCRRSDLSKATNHYNDKVMTLISTTKSVWSKKRTLREEKKVLGFYCTNHPFKYYKRELRNLVYTNLNEAKNSMATGTHAIVCGIINTIVPRTIDGTRILILNVEDDTDQCSIIIDDGCLCCSLSKDKLVLVSGKVFLTKTRYKLRVLADIIIGLNQLRSTYCRLLVISDLEEAGVRTLKWILEECGDPNGRRCGIAVKRKRYGAHVLAGKLIGSLAKIARVLKRRSGFWRISHIY